MSRCELSGKGPVVGNLVSHSNIKTKSISQPNVQYKKFHSQALNDSFTLKVAASTIRTMEHVGGFDSFLLKQETCALSRKAQAIRKRIKTRLAGKGAKKVATPDAKITKTKN